VFPEAAAEEVEAEVDELEAQREKKVLRCHGLLELTQAARNQGVVLSYASRLLYCFSFVWGL
jgi:hypothetical protein